MSSLKFVRVRLRLAQLPLPSVTVFSKYGKEDISICTGILDVTSEHLDFVLSHCKEENNGI